MHPRFNFAKASPESYKAVSALENFVQTCGLERRFIHLIKLRASQINGCAYCVDIHVLIVRFCYTFFNILDAMQVHEVKSNAADQRQQSLLVHPYQ